VMTEIFELLKELPYPGRGLFVGKSADGTKAQIFYFLTGRSENSRNRVFVRDGDGIRTQAFDPSKMTDPSLIIYSPVRVLGNATIVTNGDQTDTVYEALQSGDTFESALTERTFEPDAPNYTPRISALLETENESMRYTMSMIRTIEGNPDYCAHEIYRYSSPKAGEGHFLRTYEGYGAPVPSFQGVPVLCSTADWGTEPDALIDRIWDSLNRDNRVSLFLRTVDLSSGEREDRIRNALQ